MTASIEKRAPRLRDGESGTPPDRVGCGEWANMTIAHYSGLNRTPALPLAVRGWLSLIESGHCSNVIQVTADQNGFVGSVGGTPAGVLTYRHEPVTKELIVGLGYVLPEYRNTGLYQMLWDALVIKAHGLNAVQITSATFVSNTVMRAVAAKQGRTESQVWLNFPVPDHPRPQQGKQHRGDDIDAPAIDRAWPQS
jgi:Acetyltransferase (GNAT) family